ncbi:RWD domain-containing protein 3 [Nephila pilipes]|uniref:RWD domain-containing protein 3 n=1 Tax=Nephila pilipes TaxID=299642 RepID=A0A8X6TQW7_NEPPI|nr:RWD domain-containing protein 3 [Nephila pilipes]
MEDLFSDELECLKSCYDSSEFIHFVSSQSHILKFTVSEDSCLTFEILDQYPQTVPLISLSSGKLSNAQKNMIESDIRNFTEGLIGSPMILDIVIKFQELYKSYLTKYVFSEQKVSHPEDDHVAVILIDHIRQRNKYLKALSSWASDFNILGGVIFCCKWIFLIIQGTQKNVKIHQADLVKKKCPLFCMKEIVLKVLLHFLWRSFPL